MTATTTTTRRCVGLLAAALALTACGGSGSEAPSQARPSASFDAGEASAVTPVSDGVLAAAKEEGSVLVYGNANDEQMTPLVEAFQKEHGITVRYLSLGGPDTFQRYLSEKATGGTTADVIIESDGLLWRDFVERGEVVDYTDPNLANLPEYADLGNGIAALSMDPLVALFNNRLLPEAEQPTTLAELAKMAEELDGKIGTVEVDNALGYAFTYGYLEEAGEEGWATLEALGPATGVESGAGGIVQKVQQGAYVAAFSVSGAVRALSASDPSGLVGFRYLEDATTVVPRGVGLTAGGSSPNAAKLFLNYLLSVKGQDVACDGGFSPYRAGVDCQTGLSGLIAEIGEENIIFGDYSDEFVDQADDIKGRWNAAFGR